MSNITLNIVEPASPTPVDPGTGTVVPNTGLFTSGIGGAEAAIIATVALVVILAIIGAIIYYRKHKQGNISNIFAKCKQTLKTKKYASGLAMLALLVSIGTVAGLLKLGASAEEADNIEAQDSTALTVTAESEDLTIELGDEPVFAVLPVELTVAEATEAGYTLTAYTDNTDLVSTTDSSKVIPMVVADEGELVALTDNTYGLALVEPEDKDGEVYASLSTDSLNPTIIKSMTEYTPTEENDTATIYYGFYIAPDTPYGTYTGSDIYYDATINTTLVTFDGNGLYFNEDETQTTNEVEYIAASQEESESTINQPISGEYKTPAQSLPYIFLGWSTDPEATVPTYETEEKIAEFLPISPNIPITLYAVWQKATTITYDGNGADSGTMDTQTIIAGESDSLYENAFVRDGYHFTGWNTVAEPSGQDPGESYVDEAEYAAPVNTSQYLTLYAQWKKNLPSMQDVASWGNTLQIGDEVIAVDNRDGKEYYVARLADNNIWMTQNLDLDIEAGRTYTSADTDLANSTIGTSWTPTVSTSTTSSWTDSKTAPSTYDPGNLYWNGTVTTIDGYLSTNTTAEPSATYGTHYHVGNYYNWTAAVAMNGSSSYTTNQKDANQSICPAGWRLPTYSGDKSYQNLVNTLSLTAGSSGNIQNSPVYFVYGGRWDGSSNAVGRFGYCWSSVVYNSNNAYYLDFNAYGDLLPQDISNRNYGYSVRCVAR